jgi:hypothetical protein
LRWIEYIVHYDVNRILLGARGEMFIEAGEIDEETGELYYFNKYEKRQTQILE